MSDEKKETTQIELPAENEAVTSGEPPENSEPKIRVHSDPDWFLQGLVVMVNGSELEIGITLTVGGLLVSGYMVSGHKYFEGFAEDFGSGFPKDIKNPGDGYKELGKIYTDPEHPLDSRSTSFIHLKNARFYHNSGGAVPQNRGVWWRGRLTAVDGFMLGNFS